VGPALFFTLIIVGPALYFTLIVGPALYFNNSGPNLFFTLIIMGPVLYFTLIVGPALFFTLIIMGTALYFTLIVGSALYFNNSGPSHVHAHVNVLTNLNNHVSTTTFKSIFLHYNLKISKQQSNQYIIAFLSYQSNKVINTL
jgi:hypothetical protein